MSRLNSEPINTQLAAMLYRAARAAIADAEKAIQPAKTCETCADSKDGHYRHDHVCLTCFKSPDRCNWKPVTDGEKA